MKFSIIIPVYNTAQFLNKCLDSIINQTYNNLEIVIVNDGSTDNSKEIIEEYAKIDKRIKLLNKENGGIGSAYNSAFKVMSGDFVSFVDSDDYIDKNMFNSLANELVKNPVDIIHFGKELHDKSEKVLKKISVQTNFITVGVDNIVKEQFEKIKDPSLACRVFRKCLFENVKLLDQNIGIDEILLPQLLLKSNSILHISDVFYFVYMREFSVSRSDYSKSKIEQYISVHNFIISIFNNKNVQYLKYAYLKYINIALPIYDELILNSRIRNNSSIFILRKEIISLYHNMNKNDYLHLLSKEYIFKLYILINFNFFYTSITRTFWLLNAIKSNYRL